MTRRHLLRVLAIIISIFAVIIIVLYATVFYNAFILPAKRTIVEKRIISTVDQQIKAEGECIIELDDIFVDMDWDTVSIFVSGDRQVLKEELHIDIDIADSGIVFSDCGEPVLTDTAAYDFIHESNDDVRFVLKSESEKPYYESRQRDNSTAKVTKYIDSHGAYKYIVAFQ